MKNNFIRAGIDIIFWVDGVRYKAIASKTAEDGYGMYLGEDMSIHDVTYKIIKQYAKDDRVQELFKNTIHAFTNYLGKQKAVDTLDSILQDLRNKVDDGVDY